MNSGFSAPLRARSTKAALCAASGCLCRCKYRYTGNCRDLRSEARVCSAEKALLKRRCQPADLAEVMVFLLAGAAMVTGQTIVVDGGLTLESR